MLKSKQMRGIRRVPVTLRILANKEIRRLPVKVVLGLSELFKNSKITKFAGKYYMNSFTPPYPSPAFTQFLKSIRYLRSGQGIPVYTDIAITKVCPYRCWHCSYQKREVGEDRSLEQLKRLIGDLLDMGGCIIGITGGEPLTRRDLPELIASIDERAASLLFTTGFLLTTQLAGQLKEAGLTMPIISLDHYKKEVHDELRGYKGAFELAIDAIKIFKEKGFYVCLTMAPTKDVVNVKNEIHKYLTFVQELGVHEVRIAVPSLSGNLLGKSELEFGYNERQLLNELNLYYNTKTNYPSVSSFSLIEGKEQFGCGAGYHFCFIDHLGNVCPCDVSPLRFGNINDSAFRDIWRKMTGYFHSPRSSCYSNVVSKSVQELFEGYLPLSQQSSEEIVKKMPPTVVEYELPDFYRKIGFKKRRIDGVETYENSRFNQPFTHPKRCSHEGKD
ncbi:radical SAM/SPASM domain-containing protein [Desulforamulus ruminis]|uniref:Radical SAM domain protein n=1 Tax=Desulforamulus ruminis (strain ATCC 23193 / DSM 2154 / NCIMB 8452 / DL) TaxID=696281 RepID=F6DKS2_DESRL|nr:radical SAM protein [Desulforamulus ruminis]AEG60447.1 Radical SAM domain protein [Desulforamulus ruminis DSM 2154]